MAADAPLAILNNVAPAGYSVLHVYRLAAPGGSARGGGLAVVYRNTVPVQVHPLASVAPPSTHERQVVRIVLPSSSLTIINIYHPPSGPISQFLDELGDFLATLVSSSSDKFLLCGDLNCP